jgi:hypothetical protein
LNLDKLLLILPARNGQNKIVKVVSKEHDGIPETDIYIDGKKVDKNWTELDPSIEKMDVTKTEKNQILK